MPIAFATIREQMWNGLCQRDRDARDYNKRCCDWRSSGAQKGRDASRADDSPEAEEAMKSRHHRPPTRPFDNNCLDVHRYVDSAQTRAEKEQICNEQRNAGD
jgi:hypothetical protein